MRMRDLTCAFCMTARSALRFDRKGRPYFTCGGCGARCFLTSLGEAVRHLALVEPLVRARVEQIDDDKAEASTASEQEAIVAAAFQAALGAATPAPTRAPPIDDTGARLERRVR